MANKAIEAYRTKLPVPKVSGDDVSVWSMLRNCIGKDLSKVAMPVVFNEPLSFLQRITEYMEYSYLLKKANQADDAVERIEYVAAFAVSALASNWQRLSKPFNPLLGETYELVRNDLGFRIMCEQVSHHPPISAFHADSEDFEFYGTMQPKLKWGKSVEIKPEGRLTVKLLRHGESYSWTNVNCCVHNVIVGQLWFEQYGTMEIIGHTTGLRATIHFKSAGTTGRDLHRLEGFVSDSQKTKLRFLYGKWTEYFKSANMADYEDYKRANWSKLTIDDQFEAGSNSAQSSSPGGSPSQTPKKMVSKLNMLTRSFTSGSNKVLSGTDSVDNGDIPKNDPTSIEISNCTLLWEVVPRPEYSSQYYHFTLFSMGLNQLNEDLEKVLPPTDCRFRPDIRMLEEGDIDGAASEKNRLEEKQREARKHRKRKRENWESMWFELGQHPDTHEEIWLFKGNYWQRNFDDCPDIF